MRVLPIPPKTAKNQPEIRKLLEINVGVFRFMESNFHPSRFGIATADFRSADATGNSVNENCNNNNPPVASFTPHKERE